MEMNAAGGRNFGNTAGAYAVRSRWADGGMHKHTAGACRGKTVGIFRSRSPN